MTARYENPRRLKRLLEYFELTCNNRAENRIKEYGRVFFRGGFQSLQIHSEAFGIWIRLHWEQAFEIHPGAKICVLIHLYGIHAKIDGIKSICDKYKSVLVEDAGETFGAV